MNIGLGNKRKTILLVDGDAHARATLRTALESAGFTVGEAANFREGERTTLRIKPDAILAELGMVEIIDGTVSCSMVPVYIVSTAADALFGSVGLHELGISGVFLKPIDFAVVIQTLRTRLGVADRAA